MDFNNLLTEFSLFLKEKKQEGCKVASFLAHDNIPEELLDAAGIFPLRLMFGGNDELMNMSHDYLPASTCAFTQSMIGLFSLKPSQFQFLDLIDYFIVSNHCVSDICGSEIITKYFNIPRLNFYMPYTKNQNSLKYFKLELINFKEQIEKIIDTEINDEDLLESIKQYDNFKLKLLELNSLNIIGSKKLQIIQTAMLYGPNSIEMISEFIEKNKQNQQKSKHLKNVILTGCSIFLNDNIIELIEEAGGNVVFFDTWIGNQYYSQIFDNETFNLISNPYDLLVERFKRNRLSDHSIPNFLEYKVTQIEEINRIYKEREDQDLGVINHIIKFCDHFSMHSTYFKEKLQKKGIQVLNLERDYSRANRGQLSTRIEAFLEMIN
jgi:benzoyl-CoA reductase/2-hydroxyglutaryl-CoA dehydratase subunit BcrC/BadD/HgdB